MSFGHRGTGMLRVGRRLRPSALSRRAAKRGGHTFTLKAYRCNGQRRANHAMIAAYKKSAMYKFRLGWRW